MSANTNLHKAKTAKNDEFYTQIQDVENELSHYKQHFAGKVVFCNCDDPTWSAFWRYFHLSFEHLGLKKLVSTHYDKEKSTYKMEYEGGDDTNIEAGVKTPLIGNGDFRNQECLDLLDESDIVVTNPPFSEYRGFVTTLVEHKKEFIIWSNNNSITYKEIFPLIKDNKMWLGYTANKTLIFRLAYDYAKWDEKITSEKNDGHKYGKVPAISVFTNLDIKKRHEDLILWKHYTPDEFPQYDNYNAINVDKVSDIPMDYCESWEVTEEEFAKLSLTEWEKVRDGFREHSTVFVVPAKGTELRQALHEHSEGYREKIEGALGDALYDPGIMGVPITFLDKHNPDQFEIQNPADAANKVLTGTVDTDEAPTDRQTDRQTDVVGRSARRLERERERERESYWLPERTDGMLQASGSTLGSLSGRYCNGIIGVPITFLDKYNPEQFWIYGLDRYVADNPRYGHRFRIAGHETYARVLIRQIL